MEMKKGKGISIIFSAVLMLLLAITVIYISLTYLNPIMEQQEQVIKFEHAKKSLQKIRTELKNVIEQGIKAEKKFSLSLQNISIDLNSITNEFKIKIKNKKILTQGYNVIINDLNINALNDFIFLSFIPKNIDLNFNSNKIISGENELIIKYNSFNKLNKKAEVDLNVV